MPGDPDHGTPFFLSYARADDHLLAAGAANDPDQLAEKFFADLSIDVAELIPRKVGTDVGFMDRSMRGGVHWTGELLDALGTCQILVALVSARYLASTWCGMEWHAFLQRPVTRTGKGGSTHQGCIIPVIWVPLHGVDLPPHIDATMLFSPASEPDPSVRIKYRDEGVFGLLRTHQEIAYQIIVWQLAKHIRDVYRSQRVKFCSFTRENLRDIFQEPVP